VGMARRERQHTMTSSSQEARLDILPRDFLSADLDAAQTA